MERCAHAGKGEDEELKETLIFGHAALCSASSNIVLRDEKQVRGNLRDHKISFLWVRRRRFVRRVTRREKKESKKKGGLSVVLGESLGFTFMV